MPHGDGFLEEPPTDVEIAPRERRVRLLPLSGKTPGAVRDLAQRYLTWLDDRSDLLDPRDDHAWLALSDMAWTAGAGRSHFQHRVALPFRDAAELRKGLSSLVSSEELDHQSPAPATVRTAFIYSGVDGQWRGRSRQLYESEPVFRSVLDRCEEVASRELGASLLEVLLGEGPSEGDQVVGAAVYALEAGLTVLLKSAGVHPSAVHGRGPGEVAAAFASGALSLEDGLRLLFSMNPGRVTPDRIATGSPSAAWLSNVTGRVVRPTDNLDEAFWRTGDEP